MIQLFSYFYRLCLFKAGPQDAPSSNQILIGAGIILALSQVWIITPGLGEGERMAISFLAVACLGGAIWLLLTIRNHVERFQQTAVALFGASVFLEICKLPFILVNPEVTSLIYPETDTVILMVRGPIWLHMILELYKFAVISHIFRHALETTLLRGFVAALFCQFMALIALNIISSILGLGGGA